MLASVSLGFALLFGTPSDSPLQVSVTLTAFEGAADVSVSGDGGSIRIEPGAGNSFLVAAGAVAVLAPTKEGFLWQARTIRSNRLRVRPEGSALLRLGKKRYRGNAVIEKTGDGNLRVTNELPLEDYLRGVIPGEMPVDSPPQALAAQAVAARSYALAELAQRQSLFDSVASQVYLGRDGEDSRADAAVEATRGLVLRYRGEDFLTYFHSTCGGHTGDPLPILGESTCPPLRGSPCGYCSEKNSKYFRWEARIPYRSLDQIVAAQKLGKKIRSLSFGSKDPWGRWTNVRLIGDEKEGRMRGDLFRAAVNARIAPASNLRSLFITRIDSGEDAFVVQGRGWGHGVGMCQVGAMEMAKLGFSFEQILSRYYPGAALESLSGDPRFQ